MSTAERPIPQPDDATAPYWEAAAGHELHMQRCGSCGELRFPPRPMCPDCQSMQSEWVPATGRGVIYSFVVCHPPLLPAFQERAPLAVLLVTLDDAPHLRVIGNLLGSLPDEIEIGARVEVVFEDLAEGVALPQWQLARRPTEAARPPADA